MKLMAKSGPRQSTLLFNSEVLNEEFLLYHIIRAFGKNIFIVDRVMSTNGRCVQSSLLVCTVFTWVETWALSQYYLQSHMRLLCNRAHLVRWSHSATNNNQFLLGCCAAFSCNQHINRPVTALIIYEQVYQINISIQTSEVPPPATIMGTTLAVQLTAGMALTDLL